MKQSPNTKEKSEEKKDEAKIPPVNNLGGQECPMCREKTLSLSESLINVPYFGEMFLFSMSCDNCHYHKSDLEAVEQKEPIRFEIEVSCEEDLKIRVVKSSEATIKMPHVGNIEAGPASNGYVTNVEGIINRMKVMVEKIRDESEDNDDRKKAKNLVKKLQDVLWGREKLKIILEDPSGNSAIISEKAIKKPLKG